MIDENKVKNTKRSLPDNCKWIADKHLYDIDGTRYTHKDGYFNPWIMEVRFKKFLQAQGLRINDPAEDRPALFKEYGDKYITGIYHDKQFIILISPLRKEVTFKYCSEDDALYNSFAEIVEAFLLVEYERTDSEEYKEVAEKWTPVRTTSVRGFSGYHDEDNFFIDFYNAAGERFGSLGERIYGGSGKLRIQCLEWALLDDGWVQVDDWREKGNGRLFMKDGFFVLCDWKNTNPHQGISGTYELLDDNRCNAYLQHLKFTFGKNVNAETARKLDSLIAQLPQYTLMRKAAIKTRFAKSQTLITFRGVDFETYGLKTVKII